jgi:hypothetical protein
LPLSLHTNLSAHNGCCPCAVGSLALGSDNIGRVILISGHDGWRAELCMHFVGRFHMKAALSNQSELVSRLSVGSTMFLCKSDHLSVAFTSVYNEIPYPAVWIQPEPIAPLDPSLRRNPYPPNYRRFNQLVDGNTFAGSEGVMDSCR